MITGASDGIGKETTRELAKRKAKVFMACRDLKKCEEVRKEIVLETANKYVYCRKITLILVLDSAIELTRDYKVNFFKWYKRKIT